MIVTGSGRENAKMTRAWQKASATETGLRRTPTGGRFYKVVRPQLVDLAPLLYGGILHQPMGAGPRFLVDSEETGRRGVRVRVFPGEIRRFVLIAIAQSGGICSTGLPAWIYVGRDLGYIDL